MTTLPSCSCGRHAVARSLDKGVASGVNNCRAKIPSSSMETCRSNPRLGDRGRTLDLIDRSRSLGQGRTWGERGPA